jgi:hypothetical protein
LCLIADAMGPKARLAVNTNVRKGVCRTGEGLEEGKKDRQETNIPIFRKTPDHFVSITS